jgi:predicted secreted hydrolase
MGRLWAAMAMLALIFGCSDAPPESRAAQQRTGLRLLGGETGDGFARAIEPREFVFPADHGSHPGFRTEWWYFTGNLETATGRHFGFELTFFRYGLAAPADTSPGSSAWRADQAWMAHLAVADVVGGRFVARERVTRGALDLAGATSEPLKIWVKDWAATGSGAGDELSLQLEARDDAIGIDLNLESTVPHVAHGDRGLDKKGASPGNASHYYSVPQLAAEGRLTIDGQTFDVRGSAWLDREWSTSSLEPGTVGWDWFALHLSDGGSLMFYRLRSEDGGASPYSGGTLVSASGARTRLAADDVTLTPLDEWISPATRVRYPVAWRLAIPAAGISLDVRPYLDKQEVDLSVRYWEGAVHAEGQGPSGRLEAEGYLELAGYD